MEEVRRVESSCNFWCQLCRLLLKLQIILRQLLTATALLQMKFDFKIEKDLYRTYIITDLMYEQCTWMFSGNYYVITMTQNKRTLTLEKFFMFFSYKRIFDNGCSYLQCEVLKSEYTHYLVFVAKHIIQNKSWSM